MAMPGWGAVILAAGAARRFGAPKMLAMLDGVPVIRRTAEAVVAAGFDDVVVAAGAQYAAIAEALAGLDCRIIEAPDWEEGIAASIRAGSAALEAVDRGMFLFLGDMPLVPIALCAPLAALAEASGYAARPSVSGKPGHPVCFVRSAMADLAMLHGDGGAAAMLRRKDVAYMPTDDSGTLLDIDAPDDLAAAERAWKSRTTSATSDSAISRGALPKP